MVEKTQRALSDYCSQKKICLNISATPIHSYSCCAKRSSSIIIALVDDMGRESDSNGRKQVSKFRVLKIGCSLDTALTVLDLYYN